MTCLHFCSHGAALLVRWFGSGRRSELKGSKIAGQVKEAKGGRNKSRPLSLMLAPEVKSSSNSFEVFRPGGPSRTARGRVQHEHPTAPRGLSRGRPASLGGLSRAGGVRASDWYAYEFWRFVFVKNKIAEAAQTLLEFPPMQKGASFNLEALKQELEKMRMIPRSSFLTNWVYST